MCIAVEVINRDGGVAAKEISNEMMADSPLSDSLICLCWVFFVSSSCSPGVQSIFRCHKTLLLIFSYVQR